jgi:predicted MFS family arabinose efflux permease
MFSTSYRCYVLAVLLLVAIFNYMDRMIISVLQQSIQDEFNVTDAGFSQLAWCFSIAFFAFGIPLARLSDRYSRINIVTICLLVWSGMTACCGLAQTFWQLGLARAGVAAGEAGAFTILHSVIADYFGPRRRTTAMAVQSAGVPIGVMLGISVGGVAAHAYGWRASFLLVGLPGLMLAVILWLTVKEPPRGHSDKMIDSGQTPQLWVVFKHLWSVRSFRNVVVAVALQSITWFGIYQWTPTFFIRSYGLDQHQVGLELGRLLGISGVIGMLASGFLADYLSRRDRRWYMWLCALAALIQIPLFALAFLGGSKNESLAWLFFPMVAFGLFTVVPVSVVIGLAPLRMRATADSIRVFLAMNLFGSALGSSAIGKLSDLLRPHFGVTSLRFSLLAVIVIANSAAFIYYLAAARTVADDLEKNWLLQTAGTETNTT